MHDEKPKAPAGVGIDGCSHGWLAVIVDQEGNAHSRCEPDLGFLSDLLPVRVLIDMPIGLPSAQAPARLCDQRARKLLGKGATSRVFSQPIREVLEVENYIDLCQKSRALTGKAISKQSFNILPKIRELDRLLRLQQQMQQYILESHPEVCFTQLAGETLPPKKTFLGLEARLRCLEKRWENARMRFESIREVHPRLSQVADDDILDAMVLAWVAAKTTTATLPENPPFDDCGLPMQIVFPV
ncbi:MAG: DUF429 domain-containing protein [Verrucomicrobiota bacterium]